MVQQQVILITGASSGFGKITASLLASEGHIVYGTSRKKEAVLLPGIRPLVMDVTDPVSVNSGVGHIISEQGHIDVVINNAGMGISGAVELATPEEIRQQMDTNFMGTVYVCREVLPFMRTARQGKIINISSIGGIMGVPFQGFYCASKFAVEGYSEALRLEVSRFNIRVCVVEPGDFKTGFTRHRHISAPTLKHPVYGKSFASTLEIIEREENNGTDPQKLANVLSRLVRTSRAPFRTKTGRAAQVWVARCKGWLPDKWVNFLLKKYYKL